MYYKFPDYLYGRPNIDYLKAIPANFTIAANLDVCDKGSKAIILAGNNSGSAYVQLYKFREENLAGEMELINYASSGGYWESPSSNPYIFDTDKPIKIIKYSNNEPSLVAQVATRQATTSVLFFSVKFSDDPNINSYVRQIDFQLLEAGLIPSSMVVDEQNNLLFVVFGKKIVVVDISDESNITKIAEYIFGDINRDNSIQDILWDSSNQVLICTTANADLLYDAINIVYYSIANKNFILRNTFIETNTVNYSSIYLYKNYIYATNDNSIDRNGADSLRSNVGLHILKSSNNYQNIIKIKSVPFGHYWNDIEMPLEFADRGYLPALQYKYQYIANVYNNIMYIIASGSNLANSQDSLVMMSLLDAENPTITGTKIFTNPRIVKYQTHIIAIDLSKDITYIVESMRSAGFGELFLVSPIRSVDPSRISLMQEIDLANYIPYDTDYFNNKMSSVYSSLFNPASIIAIANGNDGIRTMYFDSASNAYKLLVQIRPLVASSIYDDIYNVKFVGTSITALNLIAVGQKNLYNYQYNHIGNTFTLLQQYAIADYIGLPQESSLDTRFAHVYLSTTAGEGGMLTIYPEHRLRS